MFSAFNTFGRMGAPAGRTLAQQIAAMSPSLWLEPSVTNGYQDSAGTTALTQPGGGSADPPVGKVLDLSGLGNHATQSTSTARPKLSARVNLLTATNSPASSAWGAAGYYHTSGVDGLILAPDGVSMAGAIIEDSATDYHARGPDAFRGGPVPVAVYNKSAYFKIKGNRRAGLQFKTADGVFRSAIFDLNGSGSVTYETSITSAAVTDVGNGWYRCSIVVPPGSGGSSNANESFPIALSDNTSLYAGDGVSGLYVWGAQTTVGADLLPYQAVTDANTYAYTGWPLIHQFDGVDDVLNVTFPSSLGSDCTVVTANRGTTPTILTGQTIGTSYTITATNAGRLVFPRALTAAETAIVTKWATQKGALPS